MEWVAEGLAMCFIGALTLSITTLGGFPNPVSIIVYRASAGMFIAMAVLTLFAVCITTDSELSPCITPLLSAWFLSYSSYLIKV